MLGVTESSDPQPEFDAIRKAASEGTLYTDCDISDHLEQQRDVSRRDRDVSHHDEEVQEKLEEADKLLDEVRAQQADTFDSLAEFVAHQVVDAVPRDDLINSSFPTIAMAQAYIFKLISRGISGFDRLQWMLEDNPEIADTMGFDPTRIPDHTTFSTQWWDRYRPAFRTHLKAEAAEVAVTAKETGFTVSDKAEDLIDRFDQSSGDEDDGNIPEHCRLENEQRDQVFNEFSSLFDDVLDYDRGPNASIPTENLTELATFLSRRNETVHGGRDVYVRENETTDEDYFCDEALSSPIRALSRKLAAERYSEFEPIPPGEERYEWSVDPEDRDYGEGESWHKRTESGIEQQVEMLQERGMLDRPVDICIDGTAREYHNRNDTDVEEPDGVLHRYRKYETGYAWEDITITAIYRGRAIVLANISKVKSDERFQCVRYLLDRAHDLVNVRNVYADSEFGTQQICSYINHIGCDYVIKKRKTSTVKDFLDEADGRVDWTDYQVEGGDHTTHKTTLVALEKVSKSVTKNGEKRREKEKSDDGTVQTTLSGTESREEEEENDDEEIEQAAFITSMQIEAKGLDPNSVGPRRLEATAFGVGQLYRKRWSIETAFRDIKQNFKAKPRSRCLGVRRFFFMLCLLLYNCWVLLNLIVADEVEHRDNDEILWRKKTFVIDIYNDVFADREFG